MCPKVAVKQHKNLVVASLNWGRGGGVGADSPEGKKNEDKSFFNFTLRLFTLSCEEMRIVYSKDLCL